jgi:DNA-binding NarL/FixJ family response regulator
MWRLGKYLSSLTKPELEELKDQLNLTDDQEKVFDMLSKGRSNIYICEKCMLSSSALDRKITDIRYKLNKIGGVK